MTSILTDDFALPDNTALFLDFDGTLVAFQDNPDHVNLALSEKNCLLDVKDALGGALAIISGRDIRDLSKRIPSTFWRIGNHGLYSARPQHPPMVRSNGFPVDIFEEIESKLATLYGVWVEDKGPILAIHYRQSPKSQTDVETAVAPIVEKLKGYVLQIGHDVMEIKPVNANKGAALTRQMELAPFRGRVPVMVGDDTTDEDGFIAAHKLGGYGIKMGVGQTTALYRLAGIAELYRLLGKIK